MSKTKDKKFFLLFFLILIVFIVFLIKLNKPMNNNAYMDIMINPHKHWATCLKLQENNKNNVVMQLNDAFKQMGYTSRVNKKNVPAVFLNKFPNSMRYETNQDIKKSMFIRIMIPIILKVNRDIESDKDLIYQLSTQSQLDSLNKKEIEIIRALAQKYNVEFVSENIWDLLDTIDALYQHIGTLPISAVLAIFAYETDWGTSTYISNNSLIKLFKPNAYISQGRKFIFKKAYSPSNLEDSLINFYQFINTDPIFKDFRVLREIELHATNSMNPTVLINKIFKEPNYNKYKTSIKQILVKNWLFKYDNIQYQLSKDEYCIQILD